MLVNIHPKLPIRSKEKTRDYYINKLGFIEVGEQDYDGYLMVKKDQIEIHKYQSPAPHSEEKYQTFCGT